MSFYNKLIQGNDFFLDINTFYTLAAALGIDIWFGAII